MKASIIIRTKNEAKNIGKVLEILSKQTERDFEVVIVDSGSTDSTLDIIFKFKDKLDIKIFHIKPEEFSYPYACNLGAKKAIGKYLIYLSGHSVPIDAKWLENGLKNFSEEKIAGVYGSVYPLSDASIWEKMFYNPSRFFKQRRKIVKSTGMGVLGNTNAIIRKELWEKYQFDEKNFSDGGEDGDWARHFIKKGYSLVFDPNFSVYHSHGLGLIPFIKQCLHWYNLTKRFNRAKK